MDRSSIMRRVKSKDTGPELRLRRLLWRAGYRYRLGGGGLPGRPDLHFIGRKVAVFVHGCFWHGHDCPRGARVPKTNTAYWTTKIARNRARDAAAAAALADQGWRAVVVWECALRDDAATLAALRSALGPPGAGAAAAGGVGRIKTKREDAA